LQGIGSPDPGLEGDVDEMSDADVPSLGFVVGSADDCSRLSVALRHTSCESETEVMEDEEHGDVFSSAKTLTDQSQSPSHPRKTGMLLAQDRRLHNASAPGCVWPTLRVHWSQRDWP
jgi:hypothetical protein